MKEALAFLILIAIEIIKLIYKKDDEDEDADLKIIEENQIEENDESVKKIVRDKDKIDTDLEKDDIIKENSEDILPLEEKK